MHDEWGGSRDEACDDGQQCSCSESEYYVVVFARSCRSELLRRKVGKVTIASDRTSMGQI